MRYLKQSFNFYASERYLISMILQKNRAFLRHSKIFPNLVFADRGQGFKLRRAADVLRRLIALQPMLCFVIGIDAEHALIPFPDFFSRAWIFLGTRPRLRIGIIFIIH